MEWYQLLSVFTSICVGLISVIGIILWYIIKSTIDDMKALEKELAQHKLTMERDLKDYAKANDIKDIVKRLEEMQTTINNVAVSIASLAGRLHSEVANN